MSGILPADWDSLLLAHLHRACDGALTLDDQASRAARYASAALQRQVDPTEIEAMESNLRDLGILAEIPPLPSSQARLLNEEAGQHGMLSVCHPVSGEATEISRPEADPDLVCEVIHEIVKDRDTAKERFFAVWRLLPERLERKFGVPLMRLPLNPMVRDHAVGSHADIAAGMLASRGSDHGCACLSFSLGPVQSFIEASRSVRDLWSGSAILSWLSFRALLPVVDTFGPTALIYPSLRGNPLMDEWLRKTLGIDIGTVPDRHRRITPSLPNRFIAMIPRGPEGATAFTLAAACEEAVRDAWSTLAESVRNGLDRQLKPLCADWDRLWESQISDFFDIRTSAVPDRDVSDELLARLIGGGSFEEVWPDAAAIRSLADSLSPENSPSSSGKAAGGWQARMEYSARLMDGVRTVRHVPTASASCDDSGRVPAKCSLFGSWEQMGPPEFRESNRFWQQACELVNLDGVRIRSGERLCAISLARRFAGPALLGRELGRGTDSMRFPDTATVAAGDWLPRAGIDPDRVRAEHRTWNGRWLHDARERDTPIPPAEVDSWIRGAKREHGEPSAYYAILMMDGDDIGSWLSGEGDRTPRMREVLHPDLVSHYRETGGSTAESALEARRPVGPGLHASISAALGDFASGPAEQCVADHDGTLIYSGGDDLLALLPIASAVRCADSLREAFQGGSRRSLGGMGRRATLSAGIALVHHLEDLRFALQAAREAERQAKEAGKDLICLKVVRRSGEHATAALPWPLAGWFADLTSLFANGATDRWAYRLRAELPVLSGVGMPEEMVLAEIRRLGDRIEDRVWSERAGDRSPGDLIAGWWRDYWKLLSAREGREVRLDDALRDFVTLCQGASFVARGRDG